MTTMTFDSLASARRLRDKGVPQEQAEAFAAELRAVSELELDISHLATKDEFNAALSDVKAEIIKWVVGVSFAQFAMLVTVYKVLH